MKKPCIECPFRKESCPGYLGDSSYNPEVFLATIEHSPIPCHKVIDWEVASDEEIERESWEQPCIGSLQFQRNSLKQPRDPDYRELVSGVEKNEDVFNWKQEFIKHHKV